jgi:hypothetical protein
MGHLEARCLISPTIAAERLKDHKGAPLTTVMALPLSEADHGEKLEEIKHETEELLAAMLDNEGASVSDLGRTLGWLITAGDRTGQPHKSKVHRRLERLRTAHMVKNELGVWDLAEKGRAKAKKLQGGVERQCTD